MGKIISNKSNGFGNVILSNIHGRAGKNFIRIWFAAFIILAQAGAATVSYNWSFAEKKMRIIGTLEG